MQASVTDPHSHLASHPCTCRACLTHRDGPCPDTGQRDGLALPAGTLARAGSDEVPSRAPILNTCAFGLPCQKHQAGQRPWGRKRSTACRAREASSAEHAKHQVLLSLPTIGSGPGGAPGHGSQRRLRRQQRRWPLPAGVCAGLRPVPPDQVRVMHCCQRRRSHWLSPCPGCWWGRCHASLHRHWSCGRRTAQCVHHVSLC